LYSVLGNVVQEQHTAPYSAGIHELSIPVHDLPAGVYFLAMQGSTYSAQVKVIIAR
jgi:hypothetical protein